MAPGLPRSRAHSRIRRIVRAELVRRTEATRNTLVFAASVIAAVLALVGAWRAVPVPVLVAIAVSVAAHMRTQRLLPAPAEDCVDGGGGGRGEHSHKVTESAGHRESAR